jgi:hypothetical protein
VTFSDPLDPKSVNTDAFALKVWSLKRSANYGSKHYDEHPLEITGVHPSGDSRIISLEIPKLTVSHCYELKARLLDADGTLIDRSIHGTIHRLSER